MSKKINKKQSRRLEVESSINRSRRLKSRWGGVNEESSFEYTGSSLSYSECAMLIGVDSIR